MKSLRFVLSYVLRHKKYFFISLVSMLLVVVLNMLIPLIIKEIIDNAIATGNYDYLFILAFSTLFVSAGSSLFAYSRRYYLQLLAQKVIFDLRNDLYSNILRLSFRFFDREETGQIMSRVTADVENIRLVIGMGLIMLLNAILTIATSLYVMYLMSPILTLVSFLPFIPFGAMLIRFGKLIRPKLYEVRKKLGKVTAIAQQNIVGIRVIKAFNREKEEIDKFLAANEEYFNKNIEATKIRAKYIPAMAFFVGISALLVFWYGGILVVNNILTIGTLVAFYSYILLLMLPMRFLGFFVYHYQNAMAATERITEILNAKDVEEKDGAIDLEDVEGHITFDHVYFKYGNKFILEDVSFEILPGETVAIVGTTGAGKSTIIKLIPRFYDVTSGKIMIDGIDIRNLKLKSLRKHIGIVAQETFLFSGTIKQNIMFGNPKATMEDIIRCAKLANIHDFIMSLPKGYDTIIGERGITLSGGQKQRLTIARALLKDPKILIMDDSTSSVDLKTEREIQIALKQVLQGRTSILITQRISTIQRADKIIVLHNKKVVGIGRHKELYEKNDIYKKIYDAQLKQYELATAKMKIARTIPQYNGGQKQMHNEKHKKKEEEL